MARDTLAYSVGNAASTTLSGQFQSGDTSAPLTSDTNFNAKSGEGMVLINEGGATEEVAYATGKSGGSLTIPLANRGLEGGSAQTHNSGETVKGVLTAAMWNDLIDSVTNVLVKSSGALDTTKVVDLTTAQTLTNKTLTSPVLNTGVSGTAVKDEDDMVSDSATHLATQQSIKAYVDNSVASASVDSVNMERQNDTSNVASTAQSVQFGWGWKLGTGDIILGESVTFPTAFSSAPIVLIQVLGQKSSSDPTDITDFTTQSGYMTAEANSISTTGFTANLSRSRTGADAATSFVNTIRYGYAWIAIGVPA